MANVRAKLVYPVSQVKRPVIARLALDFNVLADIRRANVEDGNGWLICELEGTSENLKGAFEWLSEMGIEVDTLGDVVES
ncbi:MAG: NIL domain-containing protein [Actinomycetota bacterium]|nr:NIL domain-containing protein [Actinomycetota bacterium]